MNNSLNGIPEGSTREAYMNRNIGLFVLAAIIAVILAYASLGLLAIYVDTKFITDSFLHHSGGFVFYLPALGLLGGLLRWFRRAERSETIQE